MTVSLSKRSLVSSPLEMFFIGRLKEGDSRKFYNSFDEQRDCTFFFPFRLDANTEDCILTGGSVTEPLKKILKEFKLDLNILKYHRLVNGVFKYKEVKLENFPNNQEKIINKRLTINKVFMTGCLVDDSFVAAFLDIESSFGVTRKGFVIIGYDITTGKEKFTFNSAHKWDRCSFEFFTTGKREWTLLCEVQETKSSDANQYKSRNNKSLIISGTDDAVKFTEISSINLRDYNIKHIDKNIIYYIRDIDGENFREVDSFRPNLSRIVMVKQDLSTDKKIYFGFDATVN